MQAKSAEITEKINAKSSNSYKQKNKPFFTPAFVQPKLTIGPVDDPYEKEADAVAERVMRMPDTTTSSPFFQPKPLVVTRIQRKCASCEQEEKLQRKEDEEEPIQMKSPPEFDVQRKCSNCEDEAKVQMKGETNSNGGMTVPTSVNNVINSPGQKLDTGTRNFMESRFGFDFNNVEIHSDPLAHQSSRDINALAYTHGNHVVFSSGQYQPNTHSGRQLLAHELAHVVQQSGRNEFKIQKKDVKKKPPKKKNLIIVENSVVGSDALSKLLALQSGIIIKVDSIDTFINSLKKVDYPIDTIYIISHSTEDGSIKFGIREEFVKSDDIISKLKGALKKENEPEHIHFKSCSIGKNPMFMSKIGEALGAKYVTAGNCYAVLGRTTPIKIDGQEITKADQIDPSNKVIFKKLKNKTFNILGEKKKCVLNKPDNLFFAAGGVFVYSFFNSKFSKEWLPGESVCLSDTGTQDVDPNKALAETKDCQLIKVEIKSPENIK